jgi:hypothetical protein
MSLSVQAEMVAQETGSTKGAFPMSLPAIAFPGRQVTAGHRHDAKAAGSGNAPRFKILTSSYMNIASIAKVDLKASVIEGQASIRRSPSQVKDWGQITCFTIRIKLIFNTIGTSVCKYLLYIYVHSVVEQQSDRRVVNAAPSHLPSIDGQNPAALKFFDCGMLRGQLATP